MKLLLTCERPKCVPRLCRKSRESRGWGGHSKCRREGYNSCSEVFIPDETEGQVELRTQVEGLA